MTMLAKLQAVNTDMLREMNRTIVAILNQRNRDAQRKEADKFRVGQTVLVRDKAGKLLKLRIDRINTKTVGCTELDDDGRAKRKTWRVSPTLINAV